MNWLDFLIIGILVVSALFGMRMGLIGAAFTAGGAFIGWLLAGQYADDVGGLFEESVSNDTLVTVISYVIILFSAIIVANILVKFVRPLLTVFTLGMSKMVDNLGGLALGLAVGLAISGAIVIAMARLTYVFDPAEITDKIPRNVPGEVGAQIEQVRERLVQAGDVREQLETSLTESQLVPVFIDITNAIPANAIGFVPADFKAALEILDTEIERAK